MNRKIAFSLLLAAAAAAKAFAGDATMAGDIIVDPAFTPALTRADVLADLQQSRGSGAATWAQEAGPVAEFRSERSRGDVTAEYLAERATVQAMTGEDSGSMFLALHEAGRRPMGPVLARED